MAFIAPAPFAPFGKKSGGLGEFEFYLLRFGLSTATRIEVHGNTH
jgi:hypothetical protein